MHTITHAAMPLKLFGAVLALALVAAIAVAATLTTGGAQAQDANANADPQPCGPGQLHPDAPSSSAAAEISSGHYALFDGYWNSGDPDAESNDPEAFTLNNNLCPPHATHTETVDGRGNITRVFTRSASNIDIRKTVVNIGDEYRVGVVADSAEVTGGELALDEYREVRKGLGLEEGAPVPQGTQLYWVRLDDPDTTDVDEDPDLIVGFSTALLDGNYWHDPDSISPEYDKPFQFEFEAEREPGVATEDLPHVFAYREAEAGQDIGQVVWDSTATDTNVMAMEAGWFEHLQWVFTKPGTYVLTVQLKGRVRQDIPDGWNEDENGAWKPLTTRDIVTSVPRQYTFQVGSLALNEPPRFSALEHNVPENSSAGTDVGPIMPIVNPDGDALTYGITGEGAEKFALVPNEFPVGVYLQVSGQGELDHEAQESYDLTLTVSDGRDREGNPDSAVDDSVGVRVNVTDVAFGFDVNLNVLDAHPGQSHPEPGDSVQVTVSLLDLPDNAIAGTLDMTLEELGDNNLNTVLERDFDRSWVWVTAGGINQNTPGTRNFRANLSYDARVPNSSEDDAVLNKTASHVFSITWQNPNSN